MKKQILTLSLCVTTLASGWAQDASNPFGNNPGDGGGGLVGGGYGGGGSTGGGLGGNTGSVDATRVYGSAGLPGDRYSTWQTVNLNHNTLIVGGSDVSAKSRAEILEDSAIMQRLLSKHTRVGAEMNDVSYAMGINVHTWHPGSAGNSLFLEGFGMVFPLRVNHPLVPPLNTPEADSKPKTETEWDRARQELYGRRVTGFSRQKPRKATYDAQKVARLKLGVIQALQSASNLRHVAPEEHVVVVVTGASREVTGDHMVQLLQSAYYAGGGDGNPPNELGLSPVVLSQVGSGPKTVMTFKVKKADVDAFADGQIEAEEFRRRVAVSSY